MATSLKKSEKPGNCGEERSFISSGIQCLVWKDKRPVAFINTLGDLNATTHVFLRNKDGTRVPITCPDSVKLYNTYMGGVHLFDSRRKTYSSSRNSMNWWLWLFSFILDTAVVNSYILHKETRHGKALNLKKFLLELVDFLMASYSSQKRPPRGLNPQSNWWGSCLTNYLLSESSSIWLWI